MASDRNEQAVSPVIGTILMVAVTVILAAVIAMYVFGVPANITKTKVVATSAQIGTNEDIIITYQGGQDDDSLSSLKITAPDSLTYFTKGLAKELEGTNVFAGRLSPGMMLTDFTTKTPEGERSPVIDNQGFRKIFNILADRPETVSVFLVGRMLKNNRNNASIAWLTNSKAMMRFAVSSFKKRKLIDAFHM